MLTSIFFSRLNNDQISHGTMILAFPARVEAEATIVDLIKGYYHLFFQCTF